MRGETGGHFVLHFCSSLVSLLSLGVNLLGHNGNSQDGRMKVLRETQQIYEGKDMIVRNGERRREATTSALHSSTKDRRDDKRLKRGYCRSSLTDNSLDSEGTIIITIRSRIFSTYYYCPYKILINNKY